MTPRTEAGRALVEAFFTEGMFPDDPGAVIAAIESEAATLERERLRAAVEGLPLAPCGHVSSITSGPAGAGVTEHYECTCSSAFRAAVLRLFDEENPR